MKNILILAMSLASLCGYAQNTYTGKVVDANQEPLAGATIQSKTNSSKAVVSTINGSFSISLSEDPTVIVKFMGYTTVEQTLSATENTIILTENDELLEEVVVSASREKQLRREVPASISVITSGAIKETKAFGIDQLVNDVPGVFMASSKAAGNEQHTMAVRSPISTRSLFLYVEDGLPIRPTAVFNHNALLEMNDIAFKRVEVLKGPASSIYGSESIGGSFNFITKDPTPDFSGFLGFQINDMGLTRYDLEVAQYANEKTGFYLGTHYVQRKDGPIKHSDYEKFAITFKNVNHLSPSLDWTNSIHLIDYRSDMSGSFSESDFTDGNYESDQTFAERIAFAFRARTTLDKFWNSKNKTSFNFIFRNNKMDQIPSYRISQFRDSNTRQLTGDGSGEINSNSFNSYVGLIQHKMDFDFANSSLIVGASTDFSPQKYEAETIDVTVNAATGQNTGYTLNSGDYILNYKADILNYAGYFQYEINPTEALKVTAALRYDGFEYNYNNAVDGIAGPKDSKNHYNNLSPKVGINYNFNQNIGVYSNYSNGFTPPQTSTLYRNSFVGVGQEVFELKPSSYNNYEVGTYWSLNHKLRMDAALYMLDGKNTLVTLRNDNDEFYNANAGKTRSYGIEYGIKYTPFSQLSFSYNGSYAKHRYLVFYEGGVDYSNTDRETAPSLLGSTKITYKPKAVKNLVLNLTHQLVGKYNTSLEGQVDNGDGTFGTATYDGYNTFDVLASYKFRHFEVWLHALNIFDELYSVRASYNQYSRENSYSVGNPRAFHFGVNYNF
ncbi:TonB-dependent receptor [Tamlana sp. 2_MG-2023]|uniref:TonB-dependent receptor n=1 Tax=unclassified Tamlana TaxID=2614803 RepID=UPI0026E34EAE|nr:MULTISPECIES: TonB-dependent receptor [unclassified Tamlana]MDO6759706.1 TonB-dependent receptor [Tamlana sp. 2_MG-2023]MDO6791329.1 TonB-dependent receptor [Tamlana sp. 1_MG-2023]